ncbi:HAD-like protein [Cryphonectria parasitica EP155]|uniref:Mitochondrial import inner membrane translocase subunit TIM50 n=1 Tax=Cryphonectria parasitica (strain ATCC 38755 / EP155) TaxID=660469 RepID=A0A9P4XSL9_CRYP1|nr:HAD-like protein [Cryphonectria parasitica EP155]KAF3760199.1 HAD-like protein [Cryphonectria parasitica EP155]
MPITAPSAASGGVPNPTDAYMMRASFLSKRRTHPGPLLVVIDLNGTLLHRPNKRNSSNFNARHHARHFIKYCVDTFWVVIWSSARPDNVKRMVNGLLSPSALQQVIAVWGRDKFGLTAHDYKVRTQCYKRLTSLWDDPMVQSSYPSTRKGFENGCWDQGNTVLIDDSAEKARSEPHNAITLPEFTGDMAEEGDILPKVHDYLNELCYQEDVSTYMRANPFKMA